MQTSGTPQGVRRQHTDKADQLLLLPLDHCRVRAHGRRGSVEDVGVPLPWIRAGDTPRVVLQARLRDADEMPDAAGLAVSFLNTRTWAESLQFCRDHPEVLGDDVDKALAELEGRFDREGDSGSREQVRRARATLAACRRDGLELGFANAELEQAQRQLDAATGPDRAKLLTEVGKGWYGRFEVTGEQADLDHAVDFASQAAEAAPGDYTALADLSGVEELRYLRFGDMWDLSQMAENQRAAVRAGQNAPKRDQYELQVRLAVRVTMEAGALRRLGALDEQTARQKMTEAAQAAQAALDLAEPDSTERSDALAALVDAVRLRYTTFGSVKDLDLAVAAYDELASSWTGTQRAVVVWRRLAQALEERSKRTNSPDDLQRAVNVLGRWLALTPIDAADRTAAVADLERWQAQLAAQGR